MALDFDYSLPSDTEDGQLVVRIYEVGAEGPQAMPQIAYRYS
jgi:hypothetical protein